MTPLVDSDDLVGAAEVADILKLSHANSVTTYLNRYADFPRPVVELPKSKVRLWKRSEIRQWASDRR
jgi:predicted DNA-binding transcriptional regulator AlpA